MPADDNAATTEEFRKQVLDAIQLVHRTRLQLGDFLILGRRYSDFGHIDLLAKTITAVRNVDIQLNDFELTRSISCIIAEVGHLIGDDTTPSNPRGRIDWDHVYRNLYKIGLSMCDFINPATSEPEPEGKVVKDC